MKAFKNSGKADEYKPIVKLSDGKYLVNFNKVIQLKEEYEFKNSRYVGTGKMISTGFAFWKSFIFDHKPSVFEIKEAIFKSINDIVSYKIENGLIWKGYSVHLSMENQMNYKNAFDLAVNTSGESLPITFKFTKAGKTEYYTFDTIEEIKDFYLAVNSHIMKWLEKGWKEKDKFNPTDYQL